MSHRTIERLTGHSQFHDGITMFLVTVRSHCSAFKPASLTAGVEVWGGMFFSLSLRTAHAHGRCRPSKLSLSADRKNNQLVINKVRLIMEAGLYFQNNRSQQGHRTQHIWLEPFLAVWTSTAICVFLCLSVSSVGKKSWHTERLPRGQKNPALIRDPLQGQGQGWSILGWNMTLNLGCV